MVILNYRRVSESENGLHQFRAGITLPFAMPGLKVASNLYLDIYDKKVNQKEFGFIGDMGLFYSASVLTGGGSVSLGTTPYDEEELRVLLKLAYNFEKSFVERRQP